MDHEALARQVIHDVAALAWLLGTQSYTQACAAGNRWRHAAAANRALENRVGPPKMGRQRRQQRVVAQQKRAYGVDAMRCEGVRPHGFFLAPGFHDPLGGSNRLAAGPRLEVYRHPDFVVRKPGFFPSIDVRGITGTGGAFGPNQVSVSLRRHIQCGADL